MKQFEVGRGYWAKNTVTGEVMCVVSLGEVEGVPTFARIKEFGDVKTMYQCDGRQFAQIAFGDGIWTASASVPADVVEARRVMAAVVGK